MKSGVTQCEVYVHDMYVVCSMYVYTHTCTVHVCTYLCVRAYL
jgi:hypothetical protein